MKIPSLTYISFGKLNIYKDYNNIAVPGDFIFRADDNNRTLYTVSTKTRNDYSCETSFNNDAELEPPATIRNKIYPDISYMFIDNMKTNRAHRNTGLGTGMHLIGIIEMLENDIERIELQSSPGAIAFHIKLGYYPAADWEDGLEANIKRISEDKDNALQKYAQAAEILINSKITDKTKKGNKLLNAYTKAAVKVKSKDEQKNMFSHPVSMVLKKDTVTKHKNFYNRLFDKYRISYEIGQEK